MLAACIGLIDFACDDTGASRNWRQNNDGITVPARLHSAGAFVYQRFPEGDSKSSLEQIDNICWVFFCVDAHTFTRLRCNANNLTARPEKCLLQRSIINPGDQHMP